MGVPIVNLAWSSGVRKNTCHDGEEAYYEIALQMYRLITQFVIFIILYVPRFFPGSN